MSCDVVVSSPAVRAPARPATQHGQLSRPGRPAYKDNIKDGPPQLALIIGQQRGRWSRELEDSSRACKALSSRVSDLRSRMSKHGQRLFDWLGSEKPCKAASAASSAGNPVSSDVILGFAVVRSWRFVTAEATDEDTHSLMNASMAFNRKRDCQRFFEHEILASAIISDCHVAQVDVPCHVHHSQPLYIGGMLFKRLVEAGVNVSVTKGQGEGEDKSLVSLVSGWQRDWDNIHCDCVVAWPVDHRLALAFACGLFRGDVSVRFQRAIFGELTLAPTLPSAGMLTHFMKYDVPDGYPLQPVQQHSLVSVDCDDDAAAALLPPKGFLKRRFTPDHIISSTDVSMVTRAASLLKQTLISSLKWFHPRTWREELKKRAKQIDTVPTRSTLHRSAVKLDIASMLAHRAWYKANGPAYRHLAFDASPQRGQEFFITVERIITVASMASVKDWQGKPLVSTRTLPLATLGKNRQGLAEKAQAHIHQTWLDYGPSVAAVRAANMNVRVCLSDMGTELGIADIQDVVSECVGKFDCSSASATGTSLVSADSEIVRALFPLALVVAGPQHIIDSALSASLEPLPWWDEWQTTAKVVSQFLGGHSGTNNRRWLVKLLRGADVEDPDVKKNIASLDSSVDSFAKWRWKTLSIVLDDLTRTEKALRDALKEVKTVKQISDRSRATAQVMWDVAGDDDFWLKVSRLRRIVSPLKRLADWVRGCDCHEQEREAKKK